jgi:hypothetical protein
MEMTDLDLSSSATDGLAHVEEKIWRFISERNFIALADMLDERFTCISLQGKPFDKNSYLDGVRQNLRLQSYEVFSTQVILRENTAVTISRLSTEILYHGIRHQGPLVSARTWVRTESGWKLLLTTSTATQVGDTWEALLSTRR